MLALLADEGELLIKNVGVNPTRTGIIDALKEMGGDMSFLTIGCWERAVRHHVRPSRLKGVVMKATLSQGLSTRYPYYAWRHRAEAGR